MRTFRSILLGVAVVSTSAVAVIPGASAAAPYDPFFAPQATASDFGVATRPFGVAVGDFDEDGKADTVVGRTTGNIAFLKGNGDGTFQAPTVYAWKQAFFNAWAFTSGDVNGDGNLDVIWGANAASSGCSVSPVPTTGCPATITVNDGDVRAFLGNGNGTFAETTYFVSGVRHNAGVLIGRVGGVAGSVDAGSVAAADIDADGDLDVVTGGVAGVNSVVTILRNGGGGTFAASNLISQATACGTSCSPIYFPATSTQNSPWGLAFGDADGDGDADLFVGDRALYVYLYRNDGAGAFTLQEGNAAVASRPNVYLGHDSVRADVGFTASLAAGDVNGDGLADLALGIQSGTQTPSSGRPHDGEIVLDVSTASGGHTSFGILADIGTMARGTSLIYANADGALDILAAEYDGKVKLLRQLTPVDTDGDGVSDYVDNAPQDANAARIDMNTDGSITHRDQLDNDFDTTLGDPENPATWNRLGDVVDDDDDNDGVLDANDNCVFAGNGGQTDTDEDGRGNACDPLDDRDSDEDGVPDGPMPGDPFYEESLDAKILWSQGTTHFVIRIDALGRFFQNEFTQLMTDAAVLSPADWATKCWQNYDPGDVSPTYEPCGSGEGTDSQTLTLDGGREVPVTLVVIPKQLWTDPPVVAWINDRNDNERFELGQHGTYHTSNTTRGDWATQTDRDFFSCETCGLTLAENLELLRVGHDTLLGTYANRWVSESGAISSSPKIDWSTSANPLISYAPPFNASDTLSRDATAQLGFKAFSASVHEEGGFFGPFFSPEGGHHEEFDQFGVFHASADLELEPPDTTGDTYDTAAYEQYLIDNTDQGGLTTWLIEEVEWSGRPCNNDDRLGTCSGGSNRENNTVYQPRWDAWLQLLDYVNAYPNGVAMTMGDVALAQAYDNAPTVANADQTDTDHDGIGDAIDGATLVAADLSLSRNVEGTLSGTLSNAAGDPIADQVVEFAFDADGDTVDEVHSATTNASGVAEVNVTATRDVGPTSYSVSWDGLRGVTASDIGDIQVGDATTVTLDVTNPTSGQITDQVTIGATLIDSDDAPIAGKTIAFSIGASTGEGTTGASGHATATLTLQAPIGSQVVTASFAGDGPYGPDSETSVLDVTKETTSIALGDAIATRNQQAVAVATLTEDGNPIAGKLITFQVGTKVIGTANTNASGVASFTIPRNSVTPRKQTLTATFAGDATFISSMASAFAYRA